MREWAWAWWGRSLIRGIRWEPDEARFRSQLKRTCTGFRISVDSDSTHERACGMPKVLSNGRVPEPPATWTPSEGDPLEFHPALPKPAAVKVLATGSIPCSIPICVSQPQALDPLQQSRVLASGRWPTIPPGLFWDDDPFLELETGLEEDR
jgi:hypothetical protein